MGCTSKNNHPNIIFILVDDLGWNDVGYMGSKFYDTPNIDRLAAEGIYFTQAYAAAAICSPTRASILTGRYPARIGITDWIRGRYSGVTIPEDKKNPAGYEEHADSIPLITPVNPWWMEHSEITLAELMKEAGYTTVHIGKWHLGPKPWSPLDQGYGHNIGGEDYGQPPTYFDPYERNGFKIESLPGRKEGEYLTDRESDEAVRFINENADNPFFMSLSHYAVHTPLMAKPEYIRKFESRLESDPAIPPWTDDDEVPARFLSRIPLEHQKNPTYAAMIKSVDDGVGHILQALDSLGIAEQTILVFFSDNGGHIVSTSNAPLRLGKGHPYEGGIRVPLIFRWPGNIQPGTQSETMVISNDFFPTLLNLVGLTVPDSLQIDGTDLSPVLRGESNLPERNTLYWHFPHYWWGTKVSPYSIIRQDDWKLIRWYESGTVELYNLKDDLSESYNLATDHPDIVQQLSESLDNWLKNVNARMPVPNPGNTIEYYNTE